DAVAAGRLRCAAAGLTASLPGAEPPRVEAVPEEEGWTLRGRGLVAVLPHEADELLLAAGGRAFLVPAARPGWTSRPLETAVPRGLAALTFAGLRLEPA